MQFEFQVPHRPNPQAVEESVTVAQGKELALQHYQLEPLNLCVCVYMYVYLKYKRVLEEDGRS